MTDVSSDRRSSINVIKPVRLRGPLGRLKDTLLWKAPTVSASPRVDYAVLAGRVDHEQRDRPASSATTRPFSSGAGTDPQIYEPEGSVGLPGLLAAADAVTNAKAIARCSSTWCGKASGVITYVTRAQIQRRAGRPVRGSGARTCRSARRMPAACRPQGLGADGALGPGRERAALRRGRLRARRPGADDAGPGHRVSGASRATPSWNRMFYTYTLRGLLELRRHAVVTNAVIRSVRGERHQSDGVAQPDRQSRRRGPQAGRLGHARQAAARAPEDLVLYELHVRDFSIADPSVPAADRGKFTAFDIPGHGGSPASAATGQTPA